MEKIKGKNKDDSLEKIKGKNKDESLEKNKGKNKDWINHFRSYKDELKISFSLSKSLGIE